MKEISNGESQVGIITPKFVGNTGSMIGCLGTVAGTLFGLIGFAMLVLNVANYSKMERTEGITIPFEKGREGMRGPGPHVEFTVDGSQFVISGQIDSESKGHGVAIGTEVGVLYNPDDPNEGVLDQFMDKWFTSVVFLGAGFGIVCISRLLARGHER